MDYGWHWRVHVALWAAPSANKLDGDFVECGVNRGFMSSAIMTLLDWNVGGRTFWLMDTFNGIDPRYLTDEERAGISTERNAEAIESGFYVVNVDEVRANFAEWPRVKIIAGPIPDTLPQMRAERIAFLHINMNCALPEVAAIEAFWDRLAPGAPVVLDDYAYFGYRPQKMAMDAFAASKGVAILSLPTGQGLLLRSP
jgi:hypothetical protein